MTTATPDPYVCPDCGERSPVAATCARCEAPMVDERLLAGDSLDQHPVTLSPIPNRALFVALLLLPIVLSAVWQHAVLQRPGYDVAAEALAVFCGFLGVPLALLLATRRPAAALRAHLAAARRRLDAADRSTPAAAAGATDGARVRVAGRVVAVRAVRDPDGRRCVAYQRVTEDGWRRAVVRSGGGVFELDDGAGRRVRVRADHVVVVGDATLVAHDAQVEVLGVASTVVASDAAAADPRATPRVVEVGGSEDEPLVLRVTAVDAPTGLRVDAGAATSAEEDDATTRGATQARGRR